MEKFYLKKRCKPLITTLLLMTAMGGFKSQAQVTVIPATDGTNICANKAAGGSAAGFTALSPVAIFENSTNDFPGVPGGSTVIIAISAPTGWQFNSAVTPTVTFAPGNDITSTLVATHTASTIQILVTATNTVALDQLTISGLEVQATSSSAAPASVNGISGGIVGLTTATNFASVSLTPALTPSVSIVGSPAGAICAGTNVDFTPTLSDAGSTPTYQWQVNSGISSVAPLFSSTTLQNGDQVTLIVTATPGGCYTTPTATSNTIIMTVNPLPTKYNVTGGGNYCAGDAGVDISLDNSNIGFDYQLYIDGVASGTAIAGTGAAINFGLQTAAGSYNVLGINTSTSCSDSMNGPVTVGINPLPVDGSITGGGNRCASGAPITFSLSSSEPGVSYQLYLGATAVGSPQTNPAGTAINFDPQTAAGTYSVLATNIATSCSRALSGTGTITVDPGPAVFNVTGGGSYCDGGTGVTIGLDGSETGVYYQLYSGATAIDLPVLGAGTSFNFGTYTAAGTYTVQATDASTLCKSDMGAEAAIVINPLPTPYTVSGGGTDCPGTTFDISLDGSDLGISYQLYDGVVAIGTPVAGTGAGFSFGTFHCSWYLQRIGY